MLKLRLKKTGRKRSPSYPVSYYGEYIQEGMVDPIDEIGYYNPITKEFLFDTDKRLQNG